MPTILHPGLLINELANQGQGTSNQVDAMLQEDGLSLFQLEDATGYIILE